MIREFEKKDLGQCATIFVQAFSKEEWGCVWSQERAEAYLKDYIENKKFVGFVSEEDGIINGAILGCVKVSWNNDEIYVDELIVAPEMQRCGIGQKLLDALKSYSKLHQLAGIVLYTNEDAPAKKFYQKNDFQLSEGTICMYWV